MLDLEAFARDGFVALRGAVEAPVVEECRERIWEALAARGARREDPETWPSVARIDDLDQGPFRAAGSSPALSAACDLLVGAGRWLRPVRAGAAVVIRFPSEDRADAGYHVEGSWPGPGGYWANVASRGRGLLALFLFSDIGPDDAPTRLVCGSHRFVPAMLAPFGEVGTLADAELWRPSVLCRPVAHAVGTAGDIYLCHPFIVHTATWPHRGTVPRMMAQPAVAVPDGFRLDGSDPSPVAQAIIAGLRHPEG